MILKQKKGLSPVIATMLLVGLALALAIIIFLWARTLVGEKLQKENSAIENSCQKVYFVAQLENSGADLHVTNSGDIPIYGIELRTKGNGQIKKTATLEKGTILKGYDDSISLEGVDTSGELIAIPMLLGSDKSGNKKSYVCDAKYGVDVQS